MNYDGPPGLSSNLTYWSHGLSSGLHCTGDRQRCFRSPDAKCQTPIPSIARRWCGPWRFLWSCAPRSGSLTNPSSKTSWKKDQVFISSHALCLKPSPKPRCYSHLIEHSMCGETNDCKIDSGALHSLPVTLPCRHTCTRTGPPWQWFQYNMRPNICSM